MKNTKFLLVLLVASFTLGLTSCKKEEECEVCEVPPTPLSEILVGTWDYNKVISYEDGVVVEEYIPENATQFIFTDDHTLRITEVGEDDDFYHWELNEDGDLFYFSEEDDYDSFSYDVDLLDASNFTFSRTTEDEGVVEKAELILTR